MAGVIVSDSIEAGIEIDCLIIGGGAAGLLGSEGGSRADEGGSDNGLSLHGFSSNNMYLLTSCKKVQQAARILVLAGRKHRGGRRKQAKARDASFPRHFKSKDRWIAPGSFHVLSYFLMSYRRLLCTFRKRKTRHFAFFAAGASCSHCIVDCPSHRVQHAPILRHRSRSRRRRNQDG